MKVLITGGAGFIGSHLGDELLRRGYRVRVLDSFSRQVHGPGQKRPDYLNPEVELLLGDIRAPGVVKKALSGIDCVYHFAAAVGVGQSMYEVAAYTEVNCQGTAVLLEALTKSSVQRLVVASSMSVYGEGLYLAPDGTAVEGCERPLSQLRKHDWEIRDEQGQALQPIPTPETKSPALPSVYAITKHFQETACLNVGRAYGIPTVALRFFNVYGTRQSLANPYTGVLAIFASRFLKNKPPLIHEDGRQRRDFVSVRDVARACRLAMERPQSEGQVLNIGSGRDYSIAQIAWEMARVLGKEQIVPQITGKYRMGDIRNCFADISLARETLGYEPQVSLEAGLVELAQWLEDQTAIDNFARAQEELVKHGLSI